MRARITCCFCALGITLGAAVAAEPLAPSGPVALKDIAALDFLETHRGFLDLIEVDPDDRAARLGLAELHLAHGMIVEGESFLADLDAQRMTPEQRDRYAILTVTAGLLDRDASDATALDVSKAWQPGAALRAYALWAKGQPTAIDDAILASLDKLPKELRGIVLPSLLDIAIATEDWDRGAALAKRFEAHPNLSESSRYWLSLGRTAVSAASRVSAEGA